MAVRMDENMAIDQTRRERLEEVSQQADTATPTSVTPSSRGMYDRQ